MKEYFIKYRIGTEWHNPHNTTTYNDYSGVYKGKDANEAISKLEGTYNNIMYNPNKSLEIISIKAI